VGPQPPKRQIIVAEIKARIDSGEWEPGYRLPSIAQLAKHYECSAEPVRWALDRLVGLGYLDSRQGVGFFVAEKASPPV
jgi:DNA-binding GntR family transcriptional regulator